MIRLLFVGIAILAYTISTSTSGVSEQPPNIILILADDLGFGDLACYGNKIHQTPNIDALASQGIRFTDFHSAGPMCSPTRAAMLTGQYQQRFGRLFDSAISGVRDRDRGLPHEAVTIPELLKPQGYVSACFGKWHLGYRPPWLPCSQGFDVFRGLGSGDGDFHTHIDRSGNEDWWHNDQIEMVEGYTTDLLTQYSVDFISRNRDRPFFLYVPHLAIHFPWQGPNDPPHRQAGKSYHQDKWGVIPNPGNVAPHVKAMIESLDQSVGEIVDRLRKWKLDHNTLVIFTSDNGGYLRYGESFQNISSNGPYRGQKTQLYEGGHRVPAIFWWPKRIAPAVSSATVHSIDLLPTIASLASISPETYNTDGIDLTGHLFNQDRLAKRMLFWRAQSQSAARSGSWKLYRKGKHTELYDLANDPGERENLSKSNPQRLAVMQAAWKRWEDDVNSSATRILEP